MTKIDPRTMKVVATIDTGVPGTGGDIATGEGALFWDLLRRASRFLLSTLPRTW